MVSGHDVRLHEALEIQAIHACWIINRSGFATKATRPRDLIKPRAKKTKDKAPDDVQEFIKNALTFHKSKFWTKIPNEYAKK
jgi:hypothetical protein